MDSKIYTSMEIMEVREQISTHGNLINCLPFFYYTLFVLLIVLNTNYLLVESEYINKYNNSEP